ncbi:methenyltetrahydrofolate cyclohydrolase /5,10-methylenetetrahydrofolate dehydrogenase (NADP+) [Paraburkholderia fungorum]|jgi:methylenetetrahydrofolate dehydrogenase (NADP+)/methenyltetrahydrofolate cyclohydrolase|uniref:bifunctional 5,10-methylenetetrahydrofolate dehydrogenase/5,10-methenyltetrahydrofolate cyclohydrolase n=1 Tax=Paraburkholderia fungorum TaxID=134537 RepID=UPI000D077B93|nr:bifunctional methylenetetrahydrofolate dehydrogenase/methenyltetrahydrofolate cyclohydrolase FolD [Paraburkholderia fungorum]PRZ55850.1 methenyltetrahydrofolate cyclohydrolase /5,10-methylenetetrahydrofolate dehydrogenase (NADP+) [Paraburkholderia fungorum]
MSGASIIDGRVAANAVLEEVQVEVQGLSESGVEPCLAVVLVGDDAASDVYVRNKVLTARKIGMRSIEHRLSADIDEARLLALVSELNENPQVHGILVQMPLPPHIDPDLVINAIDPMKDVDGFHRENVGDLALGRAVLTPCTPTGCLYLLKRVLGDISGRHAVVIGRSNIVGKPMAALLLNANCSVTILHSRSVDAPAIARTADIIVVAAGKPRLVDESWIKPGAVVLDVGINRISEDGKQRLVGDVYFESVSRVAGAITPVPGGVGPMTIAFLMRNTVLAAKQQSAVTKTVAAHVLAASSLRV